MAKDDLNYDQAVDALKKLPEDKLRLALGKLNPDALKAVRQRLESPQIDFTNTIDPRTGKGYGLYKMTLNGTDFTDVPYNKVEDAAKAGYLMHPDVRETYAKDRFATLQPPSGKTPVRGSSVANPLEGRFTKGGNIVSQPPLPQETPAPSPGLWEKMRTAFTNAAVPTGANRPTSLSKTHSLLDTTWNAGANAVDEMGNVLGTAANNAFGTADMIPQIYSASKDFLTSYDPVKATDGAARLIQMLPPEMAKQYMEKLKEEQAKNPKYAADDVIGNAIGMWATGKAIEKVVHPVETLKSIRNIPENIRGGIRDTLSVPENTEKNVETFGRESEEIRKRNAQEIEKNRQDKIEALKKRQAEEAAHQAQVQEVKQHNDAVLRERKKRVNTQQKLDTSSKELDKKIDVAQKKAKAENDDAWDAWRDKVENVQVDMQPVVDAIKAETDKMAPEQVATFKQILRETRPAESDLSELDRTRNSITKNLGYNKPYAELPADIQAVTDEQISRLDVAHLLDDATGGSSGGAGGLKQVPASLLHGWKTQLEDAVRADRTGNVKYAIGQVLDVVRKLEEDVSKEAGADDLLKKARALHGPYVDTFRNPQTTPSTAANYVRSKVTPAFTKDAKLEDYIAKLGVYDPSIPKTVDHIDNLQAGLKSLPKEQPLREQIKPLPPPLEPAPKVEPKPLTPVPEVPNIQAENLKVIDKALRKYGKVGSWVLRIIVGGVAEHLAHGNLSEFGGELLIGQMGVTMLTKALRSPSVLEWLAKPSVEDLKMIDTLPPQDATKLRSVIGALATEEKKINPSAPNPAPAMAAWLAGAASKQNQPQQTLDQVKQQGQELQNQPSAPAPPPAPPGPESEIPLDNLKKIIGQAQELRSKTGNQPGYSHIYDAQSGSIIPA